MFPQKKPSNALAAKMVGSEVPKPGREDGRPPQQQQQPPQKQTVLSKYMDQTNGEMSPAFTEKTPGFGPPQARQVHRTSLGQCRIQRGRSTVPALLYVYMILNGGDEATLRETQQQPSEINWGHQGTTEELLRPGTLCGADSSNFGTSNYSI